MRHLEWRCQQFRRVDAERAARIVLDEFRAGKIAKVTLEQPPKEEIDGKTE